MVAFNAVGRLRHPNDLRTLRRELAAVLAQDFALRLMPALLDLPLPISDAAGEPCDLADQLDRATRITLAGAPGSGRRLALQQLARRWAANEHAPAPVPVPLPLALLDDGRSPPAMLLDPWAQPAEPPPAPRPRRSAFALLRGAPAPEPEQPRARWLLLIDDLEELTHERRSAWRATLLDAPQRWPELRLAVALARGELDWPGFAPLTIGAPTPELLRAWVERLAPGKEQKSLLAALVPGGQLQQLSERLFEVALLAWLEPRNGLPTTRAGLYKRALGALLDLLPTPPDRPGVIAAIQLLAAYGEPPSFALPGLLEPTDGAPRFAYPQARRYLAARQLVEEGRYDLLPMLDQGERDELALLLATMLADPTPLYETLWAGGRPRPGDVLALGRCLRERAPAGLEWPLRVAGALARLARNGAVARRAAAHDVLEAAMPALDAALPAIAAAGPSYVPFLLRLFEQLPGNLAAPRLALLAFDTMTPEELAWNLAGRLLELPAENLPPPAERAALARWAYVRALHGPHSRQTLAPYATEALAALDGARRLRAAGALLADPELPIGAQVAALELLGAADHPSALAVIERATHDQDAGIRQRALAALDDQGAERSLTALGRTALDSAAPWDARLSAIQRLGAQPSPTAAALLAGCARDAALPLYARTRATAALGHRADGMAQLLALVNDPSCHNEVRAAAARQIGAGGHHAALDELLLLLDDPATPGPLAEAICDALGALGTAHGRGWRVRDALLGAIETSSGDVGLTLAAIRALGLLGDTAVLDPLSRLLGAEALTRLQTGPHQHLIQQPVETCLDAPDLAPAMALRLASACAEGVTPADRPTTLAEFLASEADLLRAGAAASLAAIDGQEARAAILNVLAGGGVPSGPGGATDELIATLAAAEGHESAGTLGYLLVAPEANPLTRWLAVRHLADHPTGEEVMRYLLGRSDVDPFVRGALAEALGQRGDTAALPLLLQLADDRDADAQLRAQAVLALGLLDQPAVEPALMRLLGNSTEDEMLRGMAAENLPRALSDESRRYLRDMLRRERVSPPIAIGTLRALRRARDRESLSIMLRYAQDETVDVAQTAIGGLAALGDASMTPDLVRITQNPNADRSVRLEAAGALLRLGGPEFRQLLQGYLNQGALPLRLQALEHLIAAGDTSDDLAAILADRSGWPLLLRLRAAERLGEDAHPEGIRLPVLLAILRDREDDPQLRCLAAEVLGRARYTPALLALAELAERADTTASVRLRCINALAAIGGAEVWLALSSLAENNTRTPIVRHWAALALRNVLAERAVSDTPR
jgi:HEAT repeat protein